MNRKNVGPFRRVPLFSMNLILLALSGFLTIGPLTAQAPKLDPTGSTLSGASKMVYVAEPIAINSNIPEPECADQLQTLSNTEPFPLSAARTLSAGDRLFVPYYATSGFFKETFITVQNVDMEDAVVTLLYLDESENLVACDSALLSPGAARVFDAKHSPVPFGGVYILSATAGVDFTYNGDEFSPCSPFDQAIHFKRSGMKEPKGTSTNPFDLPGPLITGQVQMIPDLPEGAAPTSTQYNIKSNRMDSTIESTDRHYILHRVRKIGEEVNTLFSLFNTEFPPTLYELKFKEEVSGLIVHSATAYLTGLDVASYNLADFFPDSDFIGSVLIEAIDDSGTPLAIVSFEIDLPSQAVSSMLGAAVETGPNFVPHSERAFTPVVHEPGWETEVTIVNQGTTQYEAVIERFDSRGILIDSAAGNLDPGLVRTFPFPDPGLGPHPEGGFIRVRGGNYVHGVVKLFKRGEGEEVLESLSYNLHEERETVGFSIVAGEEEKGSLPEEEAGARTLALSLASKDNLGQARNTEILLTNLNGIPGQTAVGLYLYDQAGLRDIQCLVMGASETRLIPVDFPAFGPKSNLSLVVRGLSTTQNPTRNTMKGGGDPKYYNTYALAGVAYQRTLPHTEIQPEPVALAPGGNDVGMAYPGKITDPIIASDRIFALPIVGDGADSSFAIDVQVTLTTLLPPVHAAFIFFDEEGDVIGTHLSPTMTYPGRHRVSGSIIPATAASAAAFAVSSADAEALAMFAALDSSNRFAGFYHYMARKTGETPSSLWMTVSRNAPAPDGDSDRVFAAYESIGVRDFGQPDPIFSGYVYRAPMVKSGDGFDSEIIIQNMGLFDSGAEVLFYPGGEPKWEPTVKSLSEAKSASTAAAKMFQGEPLRTVPIDGLQPGGTARVRVSEAVGGDFSGVAVVRASVPTAVVVKVFSGGTLSTHQALPNHIPMVHNVGGAAAYAPMAHLPEDGWDTEVHVLNFTTQVDAKVRVDFHGTDGKVLDTRTGFIPPGNTARFDFAAFTPDPDSNPTRVGWIEVVSEEIWRDAAAVIPTSPIAAVVHQFRRNAGGCVLESVTVNAQGERGFFSWPEGSIADALALVSFPSFVKNSGPEGLSTELALSNFNTLSGTTTATNVQFVGNGFTTNLPDFTLSGGETLLLRAEDLPGIPNGEGSLAFTVFPVDVFQAGGGAITGVAVTRANGLLPHGPCEADEPTATLTPTPTSTDGPTATPTESPTGTLPTPTETSTPTATPSGTPLDETEFERADINRDGSVDSLDQLILLKYWKETIGN